jgi:DNA-directed RNA polymerase subunit L
MEQKRKRGRPRKNPELEKQIKEGTDPLRAIDDTLGHILAELKKISAACEKAGGL